MRLWLGLLTALAVVSSSHAVSARNVVIGFADHTEPFVTNDRDHPGIVVELVREAFKIVGHDITPTFQTFKRLKEEVKQGRLDAAAGAVAKGRDGEEGLYYSIPCVAYSNAAIVRKRDNIDIRSIADLPGNSIVAWQNAHDHLGGDFQKLFGDHVRDDYVRRYFDLADQKAQVRMFWSGRADIIVIDTVIFDYMTSTMADDFDTSLDVERHRIFGDQTIYPIFFNDPKLRDQFNTGLAELKKQGVIDDIYKKYRSVNGLSREAKRSARGRSS